MAKRDILNLFNLVHGQINRLRYVYRFSGTNVLHRENVAEHSFYTAFYSLVIGTNYVSHHVNLGKLVQKALLHDVEEQFTGDIIRPIKYLTPNVTQEIESAAGQMVFNLFELICPVPRYCFELWRDAKDKTMEGKIVRFADFISVLSSLNQEIESGNNAVMSSVHGLPEYCKSFDTPEFDFLNSYRDQAQKIVEDLEHSRRKSYE